MWPVSGECAIGVDLGGTKMMAGVVDRELRVHARAQRPVPLDSQESILDSLVDIVAEARSAAPIDPFAVGIGVPCLIDRTRDVAVLAVNLPLHDVDFRAVLGERLGLPVFVDNDANAAMVAEHRAGAARGAGHAAMLTIGTGIGGALLFDGNLYRGSLGAAGELGHMVVDEDGPPCQGNCPNHGCLESVASGTALAREALRVARSVPDCALGRALAAGRTITGPLVTELAHDGDVAARDVVALVGTRLGVGLANIVNMLCPEVIVIGGGVIGAGELLLAPAREVVRTRALPPSRDAVSIVRAHFGAESGMLGAACLALDGMGEPASFGAG
ncbi:MAG: ROK family protein [Acidobacteriota bacterium]|nr:ROK family protein [Acidobacteriota bacterium]